MVAPGAAAWLLAAAAGVAAQDPAPAGFTVQAADRRVSPAMVEAVHGMLRDGVRELGRWFPGLPDRTVLAVVHLDAGSLPAPLAESLHPGTAGLALRGRNQLHVLVREARDRPPNDLRTVVVHELVHVLLDQLAGGGGPFLPRWLHEGLAQHLSGASYVSLSEDDLLFAVSTRTYPPFHELVDDFPARDDLRRLAYAQSFSFVSFLAQQVGVQALLDAARACGPDLDYSASFVRRAGVPLARLQEQWERYVLDRSGAVARFLLQNCFAYVLILAVPVLAIAAGRRLTRDFARGQQLSRWEELGDDLGPHIRPGEWERTDFDQDDGPDGDGEPDGEDPR